MERLYICHFLLSSSTFKLAMEIITSQCRAVVECGDLIALKCLVADGEVDFQSKTSEGLNLLDLTLHALRMSWFTAKAEAAPSIVRMGLWLLSRKVTPSKSSVTSSLPTWLEFASSEQSDLTSRKSEANKMGSFLLQVSKEETPIYRAARLTLFYLCNPC